MATMETKVSKQEEAAFASAVLWARRFPDRWALLNASDEEIREVAQADPWPFEKWSDAQIEELTDLVRTFREVYTLVTKGPLHGREAERFSEISHTLMENLDLFFAGLRPQLLQVDGDTLAFPMSDHAGPHTLLDHVGGEVLDLFLGLNRANESKIFVCEWCGEIGPASYKNRRFCGDRCRQAAHRAKQKGVDSLG